MLQKWKKCAWEINSGVIKMYCTCLGKMVCLKKENKRIRNYRTRLLQEVHVFHKRYFSLRVNNQDFMEPRQTKNKWFIIEPLAVTGPKTYGVHWRDIPGKRDHHVYTPSLQLPSPGIRSMEINRTSRYTYEIGGRGFHPRKNSSSWEEGERI